MGAADMTDAGNRRAQEIDRLERLALRLEPLYISGVRRYLREAPDCEATITSTAGVFHCARLHFYSFGREWHVAHPAVERVTGYWPDELSDGGPTTW